MVLIGFLELKAIKIIKVETFGLGVPKVGVHMLQVIIGIVVEIKQISGFVRVPVVLLEEILDVDIVIAFGIVVEVIAEEIPIGQANNVAFPIVVAMAGHARSPGEASADVYVGVAV